MDCDFRVRMVTMATILTAWTCASSAELHVWMAPATNSSFILTPSYSIWQADVPTSYHQLGQHLHVGHTRPHVMMAAAKGIEGVDVSQPLSFRRVLQEAKTLVHFWRMECPEGFASLGDVATLHNTPKAMDYRCLNRSTLTPARPGLAVASISPRVRGARIMTVGPSRGWNSTFFYVIHLTNPDLHRILTLDWTGFHQPREIHSATSNCTQSEWKGEGETTGDPLEPNKDDSRATVVLVSALLVTAALASLLVALKILCKRHCRGKHRSTSLSAVYFNAAAANDDETVTVELPCVTSRSPSYVSIPSSNQFASDDRSGGSCSNYYEAIVLHARSSESSNSDQSFQDEPLNGTGSFHIDDTYVQRVTGICENTYEEAIQGQLDVYVDFNRPYTNMIDSL